MIKSRIALLALASVCTGLAAVGCSSDNSDPSAEGADRDLQTVEFNLSVGGAEVSTVAYTVTNAAGATVKSGTFEVPLDDSSFMVQLLLPVGTDYTLSISGSGTYEGETIPCAGSAEFDVVAGTNPPVDLTVTCTATEVEDDTAPGTGEVKANINFVLDTAVVPGEECGFTHGVVGPLMQLVGSKIDLKSTYVPATATTSWASSNPVGSFANASDDDTTFTCTSAGTTVLSTSLSTAGGCTDTFSVAVECVLESCGNGLPDSGEQCDDGNTVDTDACSNACTLNPVCGNSLVEAGETCATCPVDVIAVGGPDACAACGDGAVNAGENCTTCPADVIAVNGAGACNVCGDGNTFGAEDCDDGNTASNDGCSAACEVEFCGDGVKQTAEQCDDGNNVAGDGCSATCETEAFCGDGAINGSPVETCETCPADVIAVNGANACDAPKATCSDCYQTDPVLASYGLDAYSATLCDSDPGCAATQACVKETGCYAGDTLPSNYCYCGNDASGNPVDVIACIAPAFVPNGPCKDVMLANLGDGLTNQIVLERQFDTNYPAGAGFFFIATARDLGVCQTECGY